MGLISNGTTIFDNGSMASGFGGNLIFISKQTASNSASIDFTSGINSTYKEYVFYFVNMHPSVDDAILQFNLSTDSGSNYNVTKTSSVFGAAHAENDTVASLSYDTGLDLAQSTNFQGLNLGSFDNDHGISGTLQLFNPNSSTYVKHFIAVSSTTNYDNLNLVKYVAGYGNTTTPIDAIQFKYSSGNIDAGSILMFGIN